MTSSPETARFPTWLGLAQGGVLYALYKSQHDKWWPAEWGWLFNGLLVTSLILPFVVYWSQDVLSKTARRALVFAMALLIFALSAYQGAMVYPHPEMASAQLVSPAVFLGLAMLAFMAVPLVTGYLARDSRSGLGRWHYPVLFEHAWRNAVVTAQAGVLTGLLWIMLFLGTQLFYLIGVVWPREWVQEAWFVIPVTTVSVAIGLKSGLRRAAFTSTLRNHWLTLTVWLLPLASLIGVAFVLTSLGGVGRLFERGLSAVILLWFAAFWIKFFNSAYQDGVGNPPLHPRLQQMLPATALALAVIVALAAWALFARIAQYGLTPDRIWGVLVVSVALVYGVGYSFSLFSKTKTRWMPSMGATNIAAALVMSAGIVLLLSPLLNPDRLATSSQLARLDSGRTQPDDFDVRALMRQGRAGYDALIALSQRRGTDKRPDRLALRAEETLRQAYYYQHREPPRSRTFVADLATRLEIHPQNATLPEGFMDDLTRDMAAWPDWQREMSCFSESQTGRKCVLLVVDLDGDGADEVILWHLVDRQQNKLYVRGKEGWHAAGHLRPEGGRDDGISPDLTVRDYAVEPLKWRALRIGKSRFQVFENAE